jgi:hypothetical protein
MSYYIIVNRIRLGNSMQTYSKRPHYLSFCLVYARNDWFIVMCVLFFTNSSVLV